MERLDQDRRRPGHRSRRDRRARDAVPVFCGIASGIDRMGYGAQIVVIATSRAEAMGIGLEIFDRAVATAGLPVFPIADAGATSEVEERERALAGGE